MAARDHARNEWREQRAAERAARDAESRAAYVEQRCPQIAYHETTQIIGQAYAETRTGPEFLAALETRGLIVAHVTQEDADRATVQRSYGIQTHAVKAGQYVVLDERPTVPA